MNLERLSAQAAARPLPPDNDPLLDVLLELAGAPEVAAIQRLCVRAARELAGADAATLVLREGEQCRFAEEHADAPLWRGRCLPLADDPAGWALSEGREAIVADVGREPRIAAAWYRPTFVHGVAAVPFPGSRPVGAIGLYWSQPHAAASHELEPVRRLARAIADALQNAWRIAGLQQQIADQRAALDRARDEIRQHSVTDEMTDLANRKGFYILAEHALKHAQRRGLPCLAAKLDVDGLARVNDRLGHATGDALLLDVAKLLRDTFRASDVLARTDGDEFCVLVLDPGDDAQVIRRRLEDRIAAINRRQGRTCALAVSIGIACSDPDGPAPLDELLARADEALYSVKQARRQRSAA